MIVAHEGQKLDALRLRVAAFDIPLIWPLRSGDEVEVTMTARVLSVTHKHHASGRFVRLHHAKIEKSEILSTLGEAFDDLPVSIANDADHD